MTAHSEPPTITVKKIGYTVPMSEDMAMDYGLIPDTRPSRPGTDHLALDAAALGVARRSGADAGGELDRWLRRRGRAMTCSPEQMRNTARSRLSLESAEVAA